MAKPILLILTILISTQFVLASPPYRWELYQTVPVEFVNFSDEEKSAMINYFKYRLDPMGLDINIIYDQSTKQPWGGRSGIRIMKVEGTPGACARTSASWGADNEGNLRPNQTIRLDYTGSCSEFQYDVNPVLFKNTMMHELMHALWIPHLEFIPALMPQPLMSTETANAKGSSELLWTFNDEWQLHQRYHRNKILVFKGLRFKRRDIGKTCFLVQGEKSISFRITNQFVRVTGLKGKYRRKVQ